MDKYFPSKRFIFILLSIIFALGIIFLFSWLGEPKTTGVEITGIEAKNKVQEFMALDSDHDGLKDWEEALWKTDSKKTDTDGDGTSDGDEVKISRDPLKANTAAKDLEPNDKIDEKIIAAEKKAEEDFSKLSETDRMSRELFSQYIATRRLAASLTNTEIETIAANSLANFNLPTITFKTYTKDEIKKVDSSSNETLRDYSNSIAQIILTNLKTETETLDTIMTAVSNIADDTKLDEQTRQIFERLDPLIVKNQKTVSSLINVFVPQILLPEHIKLLNSFQKIYECLNMMQTSDTDIVLLIPLLNYYESSIKDLSDSLAVLTTKLISLKITYPNETDYGYTFFNVIMFKK